MFQQPKRRVNPQYDEIWYTKIPLGQGTIGDFLKTISQHAKCSQIYTNHCLGHTTANTMKKVGFDLQQIACVTDHSNYQSLESYLAQPDDKDYEEFNDKVFKYVNNIEPNPTEHPPNREKKKSNITATVSKPPENDPNPMEIQENDENQPKIVLNVPASLPLTQIIALPKSPKTSTLTVGLQNMPKISVKSIMQQANVRQAPNIFSGAIFNNCTINLQMSPN